MYATIFFLWYILGAIFFQRWSLWWISALVTLIKIKFCQNSMAIDIARGIRRIRILCQQQFWGLYKEDPLSKTKHRTESMWPMSFKRNLLHCPSLDHYLLLLMIGRSILYEWKKTILVCKHWYRSQLICMHLNIVF